ncbi:MAG: sulfatase-like hydrolase/transferase [Saprospiraceae bacterium]
MKNILFLLFFVFIGHALPGQKTKKPNIIFILADDLGIGNISCYGSDQFKTPNIDKLASTGMRFTHGYTAPLCGPSRALILTGRQPFRTGTTNQDRVGKLEPSKEICLPSVLKTAGYTSLMVGKWSQFPLQPSDFGFDQYMRFQASGKYWNTQPANKSYTKNGEIVPLLDGEYLPDLMHNQVVDFISKNKNKPFFAYYSMSHIHGEILPTPDSKPDSKDLYTDNINYMDKLVGKLVKALDSLKMRQNTIIVFVGDNGTAAEGASRATVQGKKLSGKKGDMLECGSLVPWIVNWKGGGQSGKVINDLVDATDWMPTFAALTGAKLPDNVILDGKSFAPQLKGEKGTPREWIFMELGNQWYVREEKWKLNRANELFDMRNAPFEEILIPADSKDEIAMSARQRLSAVLKSINPEGGIMDDADGSGRHKSNVDKKNAQKKGTGL